ncbi:MAG: hypothetical protein KAH17_05295 [Bacteroidales bacterium]|nr:hypothetical protein [Bacteroidales bacterium]
MFKNSIICFLLGLVLFITPEVLGQESSKLSSGLALGGSGLVGVTQQYRPIQHVALELGIYGRSAFVNVFEPKWYFGPAADAGLSVFIQHREKPLKKQVVYNGIYLKAGFGLKDLQEYNASIGWVREIHSAKHPGRFVQLQIGPSIRHRIETHLKTRYPPDNQEQTQEWFSGMIYTRLTWFFVLRK